MFEGAQATLPAIDDIQGGPSFRRGSLTKSNYPRQEHRTSHTYITALTPRAITVQTRNVIKIGRPGYKVTKARDLTTNQRSLLFEVDYPEAEDGAQPRHRFMSAYEQKVEAPDKNYQVIHSSRFHR